MLKLFSNLGLTLFGFGLGVLPLHGATIPAATCGRVDVANAVAAAADGDTVIIPAGSANWGGSSVTVGHAINIIGAGTNLTFISQSPQSTFFEIVGSTNGLISLGGMSLTSAGTSAGSYSIFIHTNALFRVHHVNFTNGYCAITTDTGYDHRRVWGVIDHCLFYNCNGCIQNNGDRTIWNEPILAGTSYHVIVVEDCTFIQGAATGAYVESFQSGHGIKLVVRHCYFDYTGFPSDGYCTPFEWHGQGNEYTGTDNDLRGPPIMEIYNNTFNLGVRNNGGRILHNRGGSTLCYSNTIIETGSSLPTFMQMTEDFALRSPPEYTTWAGTDQVENSYYWSNTVNGVLTTDYTLYDDSLTNFIKEGRDYFLYPPNATSGYVYWTDHPGGHAAVYANGASVYYPYTPLVYPHPLVTAGDSGTNRPVISNPELTGTTFTLSVPTQLNVNYVLEFKNFLTDAVWTSLRTNSGNGGMLNLTNTETVGSSRFFRIRIQ